MVVFGKVVVFGQKLLNLGKSGCIRERWFYSGRLLYLGNVVLLGQKGLYSVKVVVFGQKLLYSGKSGWL